MAHDHDYHHEGLRGKCLCGDVRFRIQGDIWRAAACHCTQCRQWSGHYWASAVAHQDHLVLENGSESIAWFPEPNNGPERGFCLICGTSLFWRRTQGEGSGTVSFSLGVIEGSTGMIIEDHIFTAEKGDYYILPKDIPQHKGERE